MSKARNVVKQLLGVVSQLNVPAIATAAAGVLAPVILGLVGKNFDPAVIAGWLALIGGVAAALQKALDAPPASKVFRKST